MIIAGEASGDAHAGRLVSAMRSMAPGLVFYGVGGAEMERAGVRILFPASRLSVVGATEVAERMGDISEAYFLARELLALTRPGLLVLVDFPDFNLLAAKAAGKLGVKVLYYIAPQVWAWRSGRVKTIKRRADHVAVILPFEKDIYEKAGVDVTFVGHPLLDREGGLPENAPPPGPPLVALAPGSRAGEITRHLPLMLEAAALIAARNPGVRFAVPVAPGIEPGLVEGIIRRGLSGLSAPPEIEIREGGMARTLTEATAAVMVSGTVTLEAALSGLPHVIIYRLSRLSYRLGRLLIKVPHIGLANLIAETEVARELIQDDANPGAIAGLITEILADPGSARRKMATVREKLGGPGASERTARIALGLMNRKTEEIRP